MIIQVGIYSREGKWYEDGNGIIWGHFKLGQNEKQCRRKGGRGTNTNKNVWKRHRKVYYLYLPKHKNTHEYRPPKPLYAISIAFYCFSEIEGKNLLLKTIQNSNIGLESVKMDWT